MGGIPPTGASHGANKWQEPIKGILPLLKEERP